MLERENERGRERGGLQTERQQKEQRGKGVNGDTFREKERIRATDGRTDRQSEGWPLRNGWR